MTTTNEIIATLSSLPNMSADTAASFVTTGTDIAAIKNFAISQGVKSKDFDAALRRHRVAKELSGYPNTVTEYVDLMVKYQGLTVQYNGIIQRHATPFVRNANGEKEYITPNLWETYEFKSMIDTQFRGSIILPDLQLDCRCFAADHGLTFSPSAINDACDRWFRDALTQRLWLLKAEIDYTDIKFIRDEGQDSLKRLADTCFECPSGEDFVVAVFNKFIWQVKRKIAGLPVTNHLMPVVLGIQGNGKSTLVLNMLEPVTELKALSDFNQICDDRNISLWRNFVLFLDEMANATRSDMSTVKHLVTAEYLTRRPMRSNGNVIVKQNATFIGAANKSELSELIKDETGTRRFVSIVMLDEPDRDAINAINWQHVWQSVDETKDDPMTPFWSVLQAIQAEDRTATTTEEWLATLTSKSVLTTCSLSDAALSTNDLFPDFTEWERMHFPKAQTSLRGFAIEMKRLASRPGGRFAPARVRATGGAMRYDWQR